MFTNLQNLHKLNDHLQFIKDKSWYENIFCVGWSIRDTILWKKEVIDDIDITWPFHPNEFREKINIKDFSNEMSIFRTEKYGTMTIIPKDSDDKLQYEITPFRTEWEYTDNRRPDEIFWSDLLLEDAKRRDFTINCMYYYKTWTDAIIAEDKATQFKDSLDEKTTTKIFTELTNKWIYFFPSIKICIIQNQDIISKIFNPEKTSLVLNHWRKEDFFDKEYFQTLVKKHTLLEDEDRGILIDPYLWLQSLENKKLTAVGEPDQRIGEDALRIIRALRFSQILLFDFDKKLRNSLRKNFYRVKTLPKERLKIEIDKISKKWSLFGFISLCDELNITKTLFPALYDTKNITQPVRYHPFDVYVHTTLVLRHLEKLLQDYDFLIQQTYLLKWAALYHDVGKVDQYYSYTLFSDKDECNKIGELNHRNSSSILMIDDFKKLWFSKKELTEIKWYIDNHHKTYENVINSKSSSHKKKLRILYSEWWYERTKNLLLLTQADILWQYNPIQTDNILLTDYLFDILDELKEEEWQFTMKSLVVNWNWLMEKFKLEPWKQLWKLLTQVFERVLNDVQKRNNLDQISTYAKSLIKNTNK